MAGLAWPGHANDIHAGRAWMIVLVGGGWCLIRTLDHPDPDLERPPPNSTHLGVGVIKQNIWLFCTILGNYCAKVQ